MDLQSSKLKKKILKSQIICFQVNEKYWTYKLCNRNLFSVNGHHLNVKDICVNVASQVIKKQN
jgi:hypothetical protein